MLVDDVRRRLISSTCRAVIDQAVPLKIFSRATIVDGLVLCGGSVEQFNTRYNAWRKHRAKAVIVVTVGPNDDDVRCEEEPQFLDFIRSAEALSAIDAHSNELLEPLTNVLQLQQIFKFQIFDAATAAQVLFACDGSLSTAIYILQRLLPHLDTGVPPLATKWLVWNVARLYREPWASLREDWRAPQEVLDARLV